MKRPIFLTIFLIAGILPSFAQTLTPAIDKSPLDVSYFPNNYTLLKIQDKITGPALARIIYSRPQKINRSVFGGLIEYGKVWRLGANEATEIEFFQNVKIYNLPVKKGRYTLYCIPYEDRWTFILNKELDTWGSFKYDQKKDLIRVDAPVKAQQDITESLSMYFDKTDKGFSLNVLWDSIKVSLPISL